MDAVAIVLHGHLQNISGLIKDVIMREIAREEKGVLAFVPDRSGLPRTNSGSVAALHPK
jgi:hypothetical protein